VGEVNIADTWLLRDILTTAGVYERYALLLIDTAGRTGSLVTQAMYAADVAYAPVMNSSDAIRKAREARERVERIQRAHPLRWAGVVLTGFDHRRSSMDAAIREQAYESLGEQVRAEIPRRALVHEAYQLTERLGDRREVAAAGLAGIIAAFLHRDLLGRTDLCEIPTEGVLR
jgi:cellulose biosynthesis protein BcsQ